MRLSGRRSYMITRGDRRVGRAASGSTPQTVHPKLEIWRSGAPRGRSQGLARSERVLHYAGCPVDRGRRRGCRGHLRPPHGARPRSGACSACRSTGHASRSRRCWPTRCTWCPSWWTGGEGYRFSGRLRLGGLLLTAEGLGTRHPVVAQRDLTARACSLDIDFEGVSLAA
jgi:hypothetical protein